MRFSLTRYGQSDQFGHHPLIVMDNIVKTAHNHKTITSPFDFPARLGSDAKNSVFERERLVEL